MLKNKKLAIFLPLILASVFILGMMLGKKLKSGSVRHTPFFIHSPDNKLSAIIEMINEDYVDSVSTDSIIEKAIPMVLAELDPHSVYIPAKDLKRHSEPLNGNFDGIGIQFNMQKDTIIVINTISGGPSERIGILPGDRIVKINDTTFAGVKATNEDVIKRLKGPRGTTVKVGVVRRSTKDTLSFEIIRDKIPLYSIDVSYMINDNIGFIKISRFSRTTYDEFMKAVGELEEQNCKKLIIDLRGNGGGYLDIASRIIDEFLDENQLIVYTEGRSRPRQDYKATSNNSCVNKDVIVLTDEWSASASEIFAGAIQDNDKGIIIGRRTFGKGLVQEPTQFRDGSGLRLTIARYYTPAGRCIQKPYNGNHDEYNLELSRRFAHGELTEQDSIHYTDTIKYYTKSGKVVYGGGGIMPDIFVPIDTSGNTKYLKTISNMGLIYQFALDYVDNKREDMKNLKSASQMIDYLNKQKILNQFIAYAAKKKVKPNKKEINISRKIIETQLQALIARNTIDDKGYYPILQNIDNTLLRAISELTKE